MDHYFLDILYITFTLVFGKSFTSKGSSYINKWVLCYIATITFITIFIFSLSDVLFINISFLYKFPDL